MEKENISDKDLVSERRVGFDGSFNWKLGKTWIKEREYEKMKEKVTLFLMILALLSSILWTLKIHGFY